MLEAIQKLRAMKTMKWKLMHPKLETFDDLFFPFTQYNF